MGVHTESGGGSLSPSPFARACAASKVAAAAREVNRAAVDATVFTARYTPPGRQQDPPRLPMNATPPGCNIERDAICRATRALLSDGDR